MPRPIESIPQATTRYDTPRYFAIQVYFMPNLPQPLHWFPGHMHKARQQLRTHLKQVDQLLVVCDSRIPFSSTNPLLAELRGAKPWTHICTKTDLADPNITRQWRADNQTQPHTALATHYIDARNSREVHRLLLSGREPSQPGRRVKMMVVGIPNAGKSTLINSLAGRAVAATGDEAAMTRAPQWVQCREDYWLLDTAGLLWPKIENPHSGYRLAITGAIRDTALPHIEVARYALAYLCEHYPQRVAERYALAGADGEHAAAHAADDEPLVQLGRGRGCLVKGGHVDLDRTAKLLMTDIRGGRLGRLSWETPAMRHAELGLGAAR